MNLCIEAYRMEETAGKLEKLVDALMALEVRLSRQTSNMEKLILQQRAHSEAEQLGKVTFPLFTCFRKLQLKI